jgi:hypothetical protein
VGGVLKPLAKARPRAREKDEGKAASSDMPTTSLGKKLRRIWDDIHTWKPATSWRDFGTYTELRALNEGEWRLIELAVSKGYPATIHPHGWISGVALVVYEPGVPIYPGIDIEPIPVIQVTSAQVPGNSPKKRHDEQRYSPSVERPTPDGTWAIFTKLCNTEANLAVCKREGIQPPQPIGRYQY